MCPRNHITLRLWAPHIYRLRADALPSSHNVGRFLRVVLVLGGTRTTRKPVTLPPKNTTAYAAHPPLPLRAASVLAISSFAWAILA